MRKLSALLAALIFCSWASSLSFADPIPFNYVVQNPPGLYGNLNQNDMDVYPANACGPASVTNALVYLQGSCADYGSALVPDQSYSGLIALGDTLATYMNTQPAGTADDNMIMGAVNYIEDVAPNVTLYSAECWEQWSSQPQPAWDQIAIPTAQYIYQSLAEGATVEVGLEFPNGTGHWVTVTGLSWIDTDQTDYVESTENAQLYYIDPETGAPGSCKIYQNSADDVLRTPSPYGTWIQAAFTILPKSALTGQKYTITELMVPGEEQYGNTTVANSINNAGQVAGWSDYGNYVRPFLYSAGQMQILSLPPGAPQYGISFGYGINNAGQVVGFFTTSAYIHHAFLYSDGQMEDLGTLLENNYSVAYGINNAGQVVGQADNGSGALHAFLYSAGQTIDLGTLPGGTSSQANGINNAGQVVGWSATASGATHAFLYSLGQMIDLGPGRAFGINNAGQVVGVNGAGHAFLYSGGQMIDLGTLPGGTSSEALGINNAGEVVGCSIDAAGDYDAFLYTNGVMIDLNSLINPYSGWTLTAASAINDLGQITGGGLDPEGLGEEFLLTPEVPEPASLSLLLLGGLALLRQRRRRGTA